ncbi:uncharacterized protein LOC134750313 [Cydia strobilella]|uniref:uncharacterized protein LOC134750313 n=1 Tax=Cydia strobilella TaxID=1100964 RepID=UPI003007DF16
MESIQKSMKEMSEEFNLKMAEFQGQIDKATPGSPTVASVASQFEAFRAFILKSLEVLQQQVEFLAQQVDALEMRSRRKILLFHGVAEVSGEDTSARVVELMKEHLQCDLAIEDIARSHRMGRPRSNQTRCILVKFRELSDRNNIWFGKTKLKGSGVVMSEFLTAPRHDLFMAARERFGVRNCFTRDGNIYVLGKDGKRSCVSRRAGFDLVQVAASAEPAPKASDKGAPGQTTTTASQRAGKVKRQATIKPRA